VILEINSADLSLVFDLAEVKQHVADFALLWNGIVVARLVAFVISPEFLVGGMNPLEDVILANHGIIELDFRVSLLKFLMGFGLRTRGATNHQIAQLLEEDLVFHTIFEFLRGYLRFLQFLLVGFLADEIALGKEERAIAAMLQFIPQFVVAGAQAKTA